MRTAELAEFDGLTNPALRFEGYHPYDLSQQATAILKEVRPEGHGAQDGWLTPYQLYDRRRREANGHVRLADDLPEWIETFDYIPHFARPEPVDPVEPWTKEESKGCRVDHCKEPHQAKGYCNAHYIQWRRKGQAVVVCAHEECDRPAVELNLCNMHYLRRRRGQPLGGAEPIRRQWGPECRIEGCETKPFSKGYCSKHYSRWRRHGDPEAVTRERQAGKVCQDDDCDSPARKKGMCNRHYSQWWANNPDRPECSIPTCEGKARAKGLCNRHYIKVQRREGVKTNE